MIFNNKTSGSSSPIAGNAVMIVLAVLVIVAVGALAYLSSHTSKSGAKSGGASAATEQDGSKSGGEDSASAPVVIEPGNPVVARVDGEDILRADVLALIQNMPENMRQQPLEKLFPVALQQVVAARVIADKTQGVNLDRDPQVREQLEEAKKQIVRSVYINNEITKQITPERMQQAYDAYVKQLPEVKEVKARHILVKEEKTAKDLIKKIKDGADFAELAKENSTDGTAANGGDLGYFAQTDVVKEFGEAAFALEPGAYTTSPVKSQFGYHVIKVEEKRLRPTPSMEEAKPFLEANLRRLFLDKTIQEWVSARKVETFDINGKPLPAQAQEPAAGETAPAVPTPAVP